MRNAVLCEWGQQSLNSTGHSRIGRTAVTDLYLCLSLHFTQCKLDSHAWNASTQWLIEASINSVSIFQILWGHLITCFYKIILKWPISIEVKEIESLPLMIPPIILLLFFVILCYHWVMSAEIWFMSLSQFLIICNFWLTINLLFPHPCIQIASVRFLILIRTPVETNRNQVQCILNFIKGGFYFGLHS